MRIANETEHDALAEKAPAKSEFGYCGFLSTDDKDLMSLFDIARFFVANVGEDEEIFLRFQSSGPFVNEEENELLHLVFLKFNVPINAPKTLCFSPNENGDVAMLLALLMGLRCDFAIHSKSTGVFGFHSHDGGMWLYDVPPEIRTNIEQMGLLSKK